MLRQLLAQHAEVSRRQQAARRMSRNHAAHGQALGAQAAAIAEQIQNRRNALNCEAGETKAALSAPARLVLEAAVALGRPHLKPWHYDVACRVSTSRV